ncbi:FAD-binding oxidoreductase [Smaragdicoccus niigatensis]|uniref:FAD-binding oxidoreductase n=1 Tax=Smaragdicoccus niigatensis TaxID=359359 RepID=UPI0003718262|nr:FAD-binding oxidoreductase [Smaragdicoccus niigatensis]
MTSTSNLELFRSAFRGTLIEPSDDGYDQARSAWNGDIDHRPVLIAQVSSPPDVAAALALAAGEGLEVSVRGGAHSYRGTAIADGGLVIDLSALKSVVVDPQAKRARVGGGVTLAELDAATQPHGLAMPAGVISDTGVAGLTLGGGIGWLTRLGGLSVDNLVGAEVVLANGDVVQASADSHPDLFWALRGGGGNFGVVTEFDFRLQTVGPLINFGMFFWGLDHGIEALQFIRDFIPTVGERAGALVAVGLTAPPAPFVPEHVQGQKGYAMIVAGYTTPEDHADLVAPVLGQSPLFSFITPMPFVDLQKMFDEDLTWGMYAYEKSLDVDELTDEIIAALAANADGARSTESFVGIFCLGGAFSQVSEDDTSFGGSRSPHYAVNVDCASIDRADFEHDREWVRTMWAALQPYASNAGGYVNFLNDADEARVRASYGPAKYDRLAAIKATYDPDNVFHLNANIKPALGG